jgi:hypothetical protein
MGGSLVSIHPLAHAQVLVFRSHALSCYCWERSRWTSQRRMGGGLLGEWASGLMLARTPMPTGRRIDGRAAAGRDALIDASGAA